ncbi:SCP2 sterol-binding domain-containing protein [Simiduia sp. 21SJ11W-1]|uniref:SCP2 sterol-binding domain-containing protein n=1 Tax=Simiduia sp. 21SJ11W-1 TaxID=2909669 RepID=UPI0020A0ECE7|nr:SCP2 sterol-binding domain-containing protein [Simiduia sp. 21SJ11W-1]UTA49249.1 SCP2 sterol-binding domain-containing protein [Simiduia sp. 21SJ11W-1]
MVFAFQQLQQRFEASFRPAEARGLDSLFQYVIPDGSNFYMHIRDGELAFFAGDASLPADLTLTLEWQTLEDLFQGRVSGMQAFMFGHIKVRGSLTLASRLIDIFAPVVE